MEALQRIVPLQNVTDLRLSVMYSSWEEVIETLLWFPNLITLSAVSTSRSPRAFDSTRESANFRTLASQNILRHFQLENCTNALDLAVICELFPLLESLTVRVEERHAETIINTMFLNNNNNNNDRARHLHSIYLIVVDLRYFQKIIDFIRERQVVAGFYYSLSDHEVHLWR